MNRSPHEPGFPRKLTLAAAAHPPGTATRHRQYRSGQQRGGREPKKPVRGHGRQRQSPSLL